MKFKKGDLVTVREGPDKGLSTVVSSSHTVITPNSKNVYDTLVVVYELEDCETLYAEQALEKKQ